MLRFLQKAEDDPRVGPTANKASSSSKHNYIESNGISDGVLREKRDVCSTQLLLNFNDAPSYLQFNPYIRSGYRGFLSTKMCLER